MTSGQSPTNEEEHTLSCTHCGSIDTAMAGTAGPVSADLGDGFVVMVTINILCSQCSRLSYYGVADTGGVVKVILMPGGKR